MEKPLVLIRTLLLLCCLCCALPAPAAEELRSYTLIARDGRWDPETIEVPAGQRFRLEISNENQGPEEFESRELRKELVLAPGAKRTLVFAPLKPGSYPFFGEFHPKTAAGRIVAK